MKDIEQYIRNNIGDFSHDEPMSGHVERFGEKLDQYHAVQSETWFERHDLTIRIAAAALIFIVFGSLLFTGSFSNLRFIFSEQIMAAGLPVEIKEVMQYYNVITDARVSQIDDLAVSEEEAERVKEMALLELQNLEQNQAELEKEYMKNPGNDRIVHAMVLNQQKKTELMDIIINVLSQIN